MSNQNSFKIAYLISRYPAFSHTFILREVLQLRATGMVIETVSINAPDQDLAAMPAEEMAEAARTYYVKQDGVIAALYAHLIALATYPLGWMRGFISIFSLGGADLAALLKGFAYFTEALMIGRWMKQKELTHLHVHFATAAANVGLYVKAIFRVSMSLTVHGPDEFDNVRHQYLVEKISAADFIFCIGAYARSQVMRLSSPAHWGKIDIAPLGVDPDRYRPTSHNKTNARLHILCVGRLTPAKGQHVLVAAAQHLQTQGRDFTISIVGDGPDLTSLRIAVESAGLHRHIHFTGALNQTAVHELYQQADVFVLPSFAEGIPVVLMEAMACGIPCISSRITGIPELIRTEEEGLLLTPSDALALAKALAKLMDDAALRDRMGAAGRRSVTENYHLKHNVARLTQLFNRRLEALSC